MWWTGYGQQVPCTLCSAAIHLHGGGGWAEGKQTTAAAAEASDAKKLPTNISELSREV